MVICAVFGCDSRSGEKVTKEKSISFYRFPKDINIRKIWIAFCKRADLTLNILSDHHRICSLHFSCDDYERDFRNELLKLPPRKMLKVDANPSIYYPIQKSRPFVTRKKEITENDTSMKKQDYKDQLNYLRLMTCIDTVISENNDTKVKQEQTDGVNDVNSRTSSMKNEINETDGNKLKQKNKNRLNDSKFMTTDADKEVTLNSAIEIKQEEEHFCDSRMVTPVINTEITQNDTVKIKQEVEDELDDFGTMKPNTEIVENYPLWIKQEEKDQLDDLQMDKEPAAVQPSSPKNILKLSNEEKKDENCSLKLSTNLDELKIGKIKIKLAKVNKSKSKTDSPLNKIDNNYIKVLDNSIAEDDFLATSSNFNKEVDAKVRSNDTYLLGLGREGKSLTGDDGSRTKLDNYSNGVKLKSILKKNKRKFDEIDLSIENEKNTQSLKRVKLVPSDNFETESEMSCDSDVVYRIGSKSSAEVVSNSKNIPDDVVIADFLKCNKNIASFARYAASPTLQLKSLVKVKLERLCPFHITYDFCRQNKINASKCMEIRMQIHEDTMKKIRVHKNDKEESLMKASIPKPPKTPQITVKDFARITKSQPLLTNELSDSRSALDFVPVPDAVSTVAPSSIDHLSEDPFTHSLFGVILDKDHNLGQVAPKSLDVPGNVPISKNNPFVLPSLANAPLMPSSTSLPIMQSTPVLSSSQPLILQVALPISTPPVGSSSTFLLVNDVPPTSTVPMLSNTPALQNPTENSTVEGPTDSSFKDFLHSLLENSSLTLSKFQNCTADFSNEELKCLNPVIKLIEFLLKNGYPDYPTSILNLMYHLLLSSGMCCITHTTFVLKDLEKFATPSDQNFVSRFKDIDFKLESIPQIPPKYLSQIPQDSTENIFLLKRYMYIVDKKSREVLLPLPVACSPSSSEDFDEITVFFLVSPVFGLGPGLVVFPRSFLSYKLRSSINDQLSKLWSMTAIQNGGFTHSMLMEFLSDSCIPWIEKHDKDKEHVLAVDSWWTVEEEMIGDISNKLTIKKLKDIFLHCTDPIDVAIHLKFQRLWAFLLKEWCHKHDDLTEDNFMNFFITVMNRLCLPSELKPWAGISGLCPMDPAKSKHFSDELKIGVYDGCS